MEKVLVTFGGGSIRWRIAANRLTRQGKKTPWFDAIATVTDRNLNSFVPSFFERHGSFVSQTPRGFGSWLWRPLLIQQLMNVSHDRVVVFLDAGCELCQTPNSSALMREYFVEAIDSGMTLFEVEGDWSDRMYSKRDLTKIVGLGGKDLDGRQIQGGSLFLRNSKHVRDLVDVWAEIAVAERYHYLDDTPSRMMEDTAFIEHRHDQSILSVLSKLSDHRPRQNETFHHPLWLSASDYPIWTVRSRRARSIQDDGVIARVERTAIDLYRRRGGACT